MPHMKKIEPKNKNGARHSQGASNSGKKKLKTLKYIGSEILGVFRKKEKDFLKPQKTTKVYAIFRPPWWSSG